MFVDLDDVPGPQLSSEHGRHRRNETLVEVVPGIFLFEVRIHSGEARWHRLILTGGHLIRPGTEVALSSLIPIVTTPSRFVYFEDIGQT